MPLLPSGSGYLHTETIAQPALGDPITFTIPAGARWHVLNLAFSLVTDATAVNRYTYIQANDGVNTFCRIPSHHAQSAGCTRNYYFMSAWGVDGSFHNPRVHDPFPGGFILPSGFVGQVSSYGLCVGDQFSELILHVESWIEP